MILREIFNSRRDISWTQTGELERGPFEYEDESYIIKIRRAVIEELNCAFVSFSAVDEHGQESEQLTGKNRAFTVIGIVVNALLEHGALDDSDVLVFSAIDNVESRMSLYNWAAERLQGRCQYAKFDLDIPGGKATALVTKRGAASDKLTPDVLTVLVGGYK